jgi:Carbohydrate-selective porin, OprB family
MVNKTSGIACETVSDQLVTTSLVISQTGNNLTIGKHLGLFGRFGYAFDFPGNIQAIA